MPKVKLSDVAVECKETIKGETGLPVVGLEHLIPGEVCLTQWSDDSDNTFTKRFRKGQVLFGRRRAYLKKAAVAPFEGICSGDITVIDARPDVLEPELLPFIIQNDTLFDYAVGHSAGSLSPRVKWEHLKNYEFQLPDMAQQRELARLLWAVEDTRRAYQTLIQRSEELVKSQFIAEFDTIADGCAFIPLSDCCISITGGNTPSMKHPEFYGGNIPFIKSGDVKEHSVSEGALWLTEAALEKTTAKLLPAGTVLVVIRSAALQHEFHAAIADVPVGSIVDKASFFKNKSEPVVSEIIQC